MTSTEIVQKLWSLSDNIPKKKGDAEGFLAEVEGLENEIDNSIPACANKYEMRAVWSPLKEQTSILRAKALSRYP